MKWKIALALGTLVAAGGCKKGSSTGGSTGGGGGGAWLVGANGLMTHLRADGSFGAYDLDAQHDLFGIACQTSLTAFVVGVDGTFLRTTDGGETWDSIDLGTRAALRSVAAGAGALFVAGDGVLERSPDGGDTWSAMTTSQTWRSIATDAAGDAALALAEDGTVWRWTPDGLVQTGALAGAEAITLSPNGVHAAIVGDLGAVLASDDGGVTWRALATGTDADLHAVWATDRATVAVGEAGAVVRVSDGDVEVSTPGARTLHAVHLDGDAGYAAGEGGEILTTSDGGASWDVSASKVDGIVYGLDLVDADDHL